MWGCKMKEDRKTSWNGNLEKKSNLQIYFVILTLLVCSRLFDIYTTYLATPDLEAESNFMVRYLGFGWFILIIMNVLIIFIFFLLFRFSWSQLMKRYLIKQRPDTPYFQELKNDQRHPKINKRSYAKHRNISLEIGITLPIYVIITGYFQGLVNLMIHLELIILSFINFLFLYPIIIGGIFGYISLYLTKKFLYLGRPRFNRKPHKVMVPKRAEEHDISSKEGSPSCELHPQVN